MVRSCGPDSVYLLPEHVGHGHRLLAPQVIFHILVVRALSQMADEAYQELRRWSEDQDVTNLSFLLKGVNDSVKANSMWVFDRSDVASLLVPELITIVGLILKSGIVGRHF